MKESRALYISMLFAMSFALFGIVYGVLIASSMVMFDGIYSSISAILSVLSIVVLNHLKNGSETDHFPFGKWHFEPALVVVKSLVIISVCLYSLSSAVSDLFSGGNDVDISKALIYSIISFAVCTLVFIFIKYQNRQRRSDLLEAESAQWMGDAILSLGVMIGFGLAYFMIETRFEYLIPYADPFMVIVASTSFIYFPLKTLFIGFRQLIFYKADDNLNKEVKGILSKIASDLNAEYKMHMVKIGRELFLEVNFLTPQKGISVKKMDEIRDSIETLLDGNVWLNVSMTGNEKWL